MIEQIKIDNNIKKGFINMSDLKYLIINIFEGNSLSILETIGEKNHPSGQTNNEYHLSHINRLIEDVYKSYLEFKYNDKILSRISIQKLNHVNIDVHINVEHGNPDINFYIVGPDLKYYHMFLPHAITGTYNSKWYSLDKRKLITQISLNLRLLEIMLFTIKLEDIYTIKQTGILGLEVKFKIFKQYESLELINDKNNMVCKMNPIKIANGQFLYGKNTVYNDDLNKMINYLRYNIPNIANKTYPMIVNTYILANFINSEYKYGISSWNNHARIIIKQSLNNRTENTATIFILDPWMDSLPHKVKVELDENNKNIKCILLNRQTKDQNHEGSCGFCAFSRLIYMIDNDHDILSKIINKPVPDFYAYMTKCLYFNLCKK